jgi:hypothetical protein
MIEHADITPEQEDPSVREVPPQGQRHVAAQQQGDERHAMLLMPLDHPPQTDDPRAQEHRLDDKPQESNVATAVPHHQFADH